MTPYVNFLIFHYLLPVYILEVPCSRIRDYGKLGNYSIVYARIQAADQLLKSSGKLDDEVFSKALFKR